MDLITVILRLLHIGGGIFWAGTAVLFALYILPTVRALGPAAGPFMQSLMAPQRLPLAMTIAALATTLSGLMLFWRMAGTNFVAFMNSNFGMVLGWGAIAALGAFVLGFAVNKPTAAKVQKLGAEIAAAGLPPTPEQAAEMKVLQQRLRMAANTGAVLLAASALLMGVARYI